MNRKYLTKILVVFMTLFLGGCWPNPTTYYFFSELEGYISLNGKPLENAKVERYYRSGWFKNPTTEIVSTNSSGYFKFSKAKKFVIIEFLHQPTVDQNIKTIANGKEYVIWSYFKTNYKDLGEFRYSHRKIKGFTGRVSGEITHDDQKITMRVNIDESLKQEIKDSKNTIVDRSKLHN